MKNGMSAWGRIGVLGRFHIGGVEVGWFKVVDGGCERGSSTWRSLQERNYVNVWERVFSICRWGRIRDGMAWIKADQELFVVSGEVKPMDLLSKQWIEHYARIRLIEKTLTSQILDLKRLGLFEFNAANEKGSNKSNSWFKEILFKFVVIVRQLSCLDNKLNPLFKEISSIWVYCNL